MAERDRFDFDLDLRAALRAFAEDAPTDVRPAELARRFAVEHPRGRTLVPQWRPAFLPRLAWVLLLVGLLVALGAGALLVGSRPESRTPAVLPAGPSPTANPDEALVNDVAAVWSNPYDAAKVAALYAPNAGILDEISGDASARGLEEIQAKVKAYAALPFKVKTTSTPIRQGNYVAVFQLYGSPEAIERALMVLKVKDGMVVNQWMYPTP